MQDRLNAGRHPRLRGNKKDADARDKRGHDGENLSRGSADPQREMCSALQFFRWCGGKACRRARACTGDAHACFAHFWPLIAEDVKAEIRESIVARSEGLPLADIERRMDEAGERYRALAAAAGRGSHPQL